ncbi:MAG: hypothetical protein M1837_002699 [Sclerophora amabilis]|nr:MAG: hypothetical protein M1837_002699 [Sclerophora amabilis]
MKERWTFRHSSSFVKEDVNQEADVVKIEWCAAYGRAQPRPGHTMAPIRRSRFFLCVACGIVFALYYIVNIRNGLEPYYHGGVTKPDNSAPKDKPKPASPPNSSPSEVHSTKSTSERYPVTSYIQLPSAVAGSLPRLQYEFPSETREVKTNREDRLQTVKQTFERSWKGYKAHAWLRDELAPVSGRYKDTFGGWAATLVDTLDTLWIMGLQDDFEEAVDALVKIDFSKTEQSSINVFETTIRYLGGFLGAYDISGSKYPVLLDKAVEVGDILYGAFDTPNRMPVTRWDINAALAGKEQSASSVVLIAELGSLTLEFTRLTQLTKDPKYFDAIQRIMDALNEGQNNTKLPGMWPVVVDAATPSFSDGGSFTLGGMADSVYEYLPKQHMLLGGSTSQYRRLYENSLETIKKEVFFRPMTPNNDDILLPGDVKVSKSGEVTLVPRAQHLACFAGGMVGIGAKLFEAAGDMEIAQKLVNGCLWAYKSMVTGIMPEVFHAVPCPKSGKCKYDEASWHDAINENTSNNEKTQASEAEIGERIKQQRLVPGFAKIDDRRYILRPEAIESIFILYRISGNTTLQDEAWDMFTTIEKYTKTELANSAINDVTQTVPKHTDSMESFWLAETLKYFYLIFCEPDVVSLDEYVLNTEAHTLKRTA